MKFKNRSLIYFIIGLSCFGFFVCAPYLYIFKYPEIVTMRAYDEVVVGTNLTELFEPSSPFLQALSASKARFSRFTKEPEGEVCLMLDLPRNSEEAALVNKIGQKENVPWRGLRKDITKVLNTEITKLQKCNKFCAAFMPTYLYLGSFCFTYNSELKVISKDEPKFWD